MYCRTAVSSKAATRTSPPSWNAGATAPSATPRELIMSTLVDFPVKPEARPYLDAFHSVAGEPEWLGRFRRQSLDRFARQGFPSRRGENWRYLDLQPLQKNPLLPVEPGPLATVPAELGFDG